MIWLVTIAKLFHLVYPVLPSHVRCLLMTGQGSILFLSNTSIYWNWSFTYMHSLNSAKATFMASLVLFAQKIFRTSLDFNFSLTNSLLHTHTHTHTLHSCMQAERATKWHSNTLICH
jgi:hypothetical protein